MGNRYVISQRCKTENNHNRVLGVIFNEVNRQENESKLINTDTKCDDCCFHSSIVRDDYLHILPYVNSAPKKESFFNQSLTKWLAITALITGLIVSVSIYVNLVDGIKDEKYFKYMGFIMVYFVALASMDDKKSSKFTVVANLSVSVLALIAFLVALSQG